LRKAARLVGAVVVLIAAGLWFLAEPRMIDADGLPDHIADPEYGRLVFHEAGCNSCHAAPGAKGEEKLVLAGGLGLKTPFGTFYAPNISTDLVDGIGGWSDLEFVNAVMRGVSPDGSHYYPAFPYLSYQRMTIEDVLDLKAYMDTLPAIGGVAPSHDLLAPLRLRRGIGLWKLAFMDDAPFVPPLGADEQIARGAYLVNGPGHCGECHTPRNLFGAPDQERAFSGGPAPEGAKNVPNITPSEDGIGGWSERDITAALRTGLLPGFETFGGLMVPVQENMAALTDADREAIAAYLLSLPPKPSWWKQ